MGIYITFAYDTGIYCVIVDPIYIYIYNTEKSISPSDNHFHKFMLLIVYVTCYIEPILTIMYKTFS